MKIWLDDQIDEDIKARKVPKGYVGVHSVNEAKRLIEEAEARGEEIELLDLDNDLGDYNYDGGDGNQLVKWLAERGTFYWFEVHTMNIVEKENMLRTRDRFWNK